jgi:FkbM family methyltransferase
MPVSTQPGSGSIEVVSSIERLIRRAGGPEAVSTVFDVGAYDGADSLPVAERYPGIDFVAVEPTPALARALRKRSASLSNYTVVEAAVAGEDGTGHLNIFADDQDFNSLNKLNASLRLSIGPQSPEPDLVEVVTTKRLSTICDELGIPTIDVIHIDTQGSDLQVLRSLDDTRLRFLRAGVIEVSFRTRLYGSSLNGHEARRSLEEMGFRVFRIERIHYSFDLEQNYFFARSSTARRQTRLVDDVLYDWHLVGCEARAAYGRRIVHPAQRARVRLAVRTRLRGLRRRQGRGSRS